MASIATLAVQLTAKTALFRKKMQRSRKSVTAFATGVANAAKRMAQFGAVTAAVVIGGFALLLRNVAKINDQLGKTSDKLGIATEKLAGLGLAAELTGVETNTLQMALQRMVRRISEAAQGTGEAKAALKELRLEAKVLAQLSPDKQFFAIAEAMQAVTSSGDRVRLAFKLFDSEGVALINTIGLGTKGLEEMQRHADLLGLSLSRIETKQIENMNDAILLAKKVFSGFATQVLVKIAPAIEAMAQRFVQMAESAGGIREKLGAVFEFIEKIAQKSINSIAGVLDTLGLAFKRFGDLVLNVFQQIMNAVKVFSLALASTFNAMDRFLPGDQSVDTAQIAALFESGKKAILLARAALDDTSDTFAGDAFRAGAEKAAKFLEGVAEKSKKAAEKAVAGIRTPTIDTTSESAAGTTSAFTDPLGNQARKAARIGEFKQAKLSFVALNRGETQIVDVNQKQLSVLEQIEANTANPVATFA